MAIRRTPPDILITTPESLYLMLTSQARDDAARRRGGHRRRDPRRRLDQARRAPRADAGAAERVGRRRARRARPPAHRAERDAEPAGGGRPLPGRPAADVPDRRRRRAQAARPQDPGAGRVDGRARAVRGGARSAGADAGGSEATRKSIWPAMYPQLLELVREHRSTIIFVNNRRGAERLALRLNELAAKQDGEAERPGSWRSRGPTTGRWRARSGWSLTSMLKAGQLPCLVATSSLELGIDMGAVDLVIQVESPKSVVARPAAHRARRPQRRRRSSKGRIFPKFRADLLECAVVVRADARGQDRADGRPAQPARRARPADRRDRRRRSSQATACDDLVDDLYALVTPRTLRRAVARAAGERRSTCSTGATRPSEFAELRPRIVWDRVAGTIRGAQGARGSRSPTRGTIPDRGLLRRRSCRTAAGSASSTRRWSTRRAPARRSCSARRTWRIEEITRDRVVVTPAPGVPGAVPFWKGDGVGRPAELGRAIGAFVARGGRPAEPEDARAPSTTSTRSPPSNLVDYLHEQQAATRVVPSDRTIVVERFRDEIGDWRLCVLSPFGGRVHAAWALALSGADPRRARPGGRRDLVRRRDRRPPPRRRRAAGRRPGAARARGGRGPGGRRARRLGAVRRPLPRERRPRRC